MQQENKNDSVQLSSRYQQYMFAKGNLRKTPRSKVFPFRENGKKTNDIQGQSLETNTITARYEGAQATGSYVVEGKLDAQEIKQLNKPKHSNNRVYSEKGLSPTLNTMQGGNRQPFVKIPTNTKLGYDIAEEKNDGIRLEYPNSKTARGRVIKGNSQTLKTSGCVGVLDKSIRRLTPIECERLQGFPDDWTKYGIDYEKGLHIWRENKHELIPISDSQRYKMCGNAVTVNVIKEIMLKLSLFTS